MKIIHFDNHGLLNHIISLRLDLELLNLEFNNKLKHINNLLDEIAEFIKHESKQT